MRLGVRVLNPPPRNFNPKFTSLGAGRDAKVSSVEKFGLIVEFLPGKEGLVHISELDMVRVDNLDKWAAGDSIDVMLLEARPCSALRAASAGHQ